MSSKSLTLAESNGVAAVSDLQVALANLLEDSDTTGIDVDCSAVRSVDAAVLQCLLLNRRNAAAAGKDLRIFNPSADFSRIAGYVGLLNAFGVH